MSEVIKTRTCAATYASDNKHWQKAYGPEMRCTRPARHKGRHFWVDHEKREAFWWDSGGANPVAIAQFDRK